MTDNAHYDDGDHERLSGYEADEVNERLLDMLEADDSLDRIEETFDSNDTASGDAEPDNGPVVEPATAQTVPAGAVVAPQPAPVVRPVPIPRVRGGFKARAAYTGRIAAFHIVRAPLYFALGVKVSAVRAKNWVAAGKGRGKLLRLAVVASPFFAAWMWSEHGKWGTVPAAVIAGTVTVFIVAGVRERRNTWPLRAEVPEDLRAPVPDGPGAVESVRPVVVTAQMPEGDPVQGKFHLFRSKDPKELAPSSHEDQALVTTVENALAMSGFGALHGAKSRVMSGERVQGGVLLTVRMAPGLETAELIKRHGRFASAMGKPAECLVVEPLPDVSPGAFELFVADGLLSRMPSPAWKWAQVRSRSYFDGVPVGVDARGRDVIVPLFETNGGIAGDVGSGKSATARLLILGAAMDPRTLLAIHNFKGGLDYKAFAPIAHTLRNGCDAADLEAFMGTLKWLRSEVARRNKVLETLPFEECPDSKLTDALADRQDMRPVFVLLDEVPRVFLSPIANEAEDSLLDVVQTARSVGITVRLVFQGAKEGTVPARILDRCKHRVGHAQNSIADANIALGSDAHGRGYRAVDIDTPGVAFIGIAGGSMVKTKLSYLDLPSVHAMVKEIEAMRREAGTLSGMAAGDVPADDDDGTSGVFLDAVVDVWPLDGTVVRPSAGLGELASLLRAHDPGSWGECGARDVGQLFREAGVKVGSVRISSDVAPTKGVKRADVVDAQNRARGR
jgi:hypothetical protein